MIRFCNMFQLPVQMPVPSQGYYGFHSFTLLTDFVGLYTYAIWLSLCKIARRSVIVLLPLSTSCWKLYVKYLNINRSLINRTKLLQTLYILDLIIAHNITLLGIVLQVVRNENLFKLDIHCFQQKWKTKEEHS
jgi:hypothetical protein